MIKRILKSIARCNQYRKVSRELGSLTDRELYDIGINRCDIPRIAAGGKI